MTRAEFIAFLQSTPAGRLSEVDLNAIADAGEHAGIVVANAQLEGAEAEPEPEPAAEEEVYDDSDDDDDDDDDEEVTKPKRRAAATSRKHPRKK